MHPKKTTGCRSDIMKTQTETVEKTESKTNENKEMNLQNIILVGQCKGTYANASVTKEFEAKVLVTARPDGTVIVHNLSNGVRPLCYIDGGAEISLARNMADAELEFFATTEDGQQLTLQFTELLAMQGVPSGNQTNSLAMSILKCVFDLGGNYGRTTIARVLTGSVSKKILTINISKLGTYAVASESSMKEVLSLIDWLIQENYLAGRDQQGPGCPCRRRCACGSRIQAGHSRSRTPQDGPEGVAQQEIGRDGQAQLLRAEEPHPCRDC